MNEWIRDLPGIAAAWLLMTHPRIGVPLAIVGTGALLIAALSRGTIR